MLIHTITCGPFDTNAYILSCPMTKESVIIDPGVESFDRIVSYLEKNHLHLKAIFLTHSHWDHIGDVFDLKAKYQIPVYIHEADQANLENPGSDQLPLFFPIKGTKADHLIKEGDILSFGNIQLTVLETPYHSPGSVCFYEPNEKLLISGDSLFQGNIGNYSFPTSEPKKMSSSLAKLAQLPPDTKVYPGHGGPTTIRAEQTTFRQFM